MTDEKGRTPWAWLLCTELVMFERLVKTFRRDGLSIAVAAGN